MPEQEDMDAIQSSLASTMLATLPPPHQKSLREIFPKATPEALDLIRKLLVFNPEKRVTVFEALKHP